MWSRTMAVTVDRTALSQRAENDAGIPVALSSDAPCDMWYGTEVLQHTADAVDLTRATNGLPMLADHDRTRLVGRLTNVTLGTDGKLRATAVPGNHPDSAWVFADIANGTRPGMSIGYQVLACDEPSRDNGNQYVVTRWMPLEASSVAIPADVTVGVGRSQHTPPETRVPVSTETPPADPRAERETEIRALGQLHRLPTAEVDQWLAGNRSADMLKGAVLERQRAALVPISTVDDGGFAATPPAHVPTPRSGRAMTRDHALGRVLVDALRGQRGFQSEGVSADGGFAVPAQLVMEVIQVMVDTSPILSAVTSYTSTTGQLAINSVDAYDFSANPGGFTFVSGIQEGANLPASSTVSFNRLNLSATKGAVVGSVTNELLADAPNAVAEVERQMLASLQWNAANLILNGTGSGQPLGLVKSPAKVVVAAESAQTAATINYKNVKKMYARLHPGCLGRSTWIVNPTCVPDLLEMTIAIGSGGALYQAFSERDGVFALFGRPVIVTDLAAPIGTEGDIVFADLSQYAFLMRPTLGFERSNSVLWSQDQVAFRCTTRWDGALKWRAPYTPANGATLSPVVTLATRS